MARANRLRVDGGVFHVTHRCHNRAFLLKFVRDRNDYRMTLRRGLLQCELSVLDYCITSNHVHLMVCSEAPEHVSRFMQKVDGEFAQHYNRRKHRSGAFWEDRFHSTMIEPGGHGEGCLVISG